VSPAPTSTSKRARCSGAAEGRHHAAEDQHLRARHHHALRAWQSEPRLRQSFYYVATGGGAQTPLTEAELDALCRRLDAPMK